MHKIDNNAVTIVNDFLPDCRNKKFSINYLVSYVLGGFCKLDDLPPQVKKSVLKVIEKRHGQKNRKIGEKK